jgi:hypothetical protein
MKQSSVKTRTVSEYYQYTNGTNTLLLRKQELQYQNLKKALGEKSNTHGAIHKTNAQINTSLIQQNSR